jgi:hypothetical protein
VSGNRFCKFAYLKALSGRNFPKGDGAFRVLVAVWNYADEQGRNAHPGVSRLAADCCMGESTVRRHLKWLTEHGYLVRESRGHNVGEVSLASVYSLARPELPPGAERKPNGATAHLEPPTAHLEQSYRSLGAELPLTGEHLTDPGTDPPTPDRSTSNPPGVPDASPCEHCAEWGTPCATHEPGSPSSLPNKIPTERMEHDHEDEYLPNDCSECWFFKRACGNVREDRTPVLVGTAAEPDWPEPYRDNEEAPFGWT